jgi:hypothetical protein
MGLKMFFLNKRDISNTFSPFRNEKGIDLDLILAEAGFLFIYLFCGAGS